MSDSFTEVTSKSWFSRLKSSIGGILVGIMLFIGAVPFLFWNEGNAVKTAKSLDEGAGAVISVEAGTPDSANDGELVHVTGEVSVDGTLGDDTFGIQTGALKLKRNVEMYQWVEKKESKSDTKLGGREETTTTYSYAKDWKSGVINSSNFRKQEGHENPSGTDFSEEEAVVSSAMLGGYELTESLIGKISGYEDFPITEIPSDLTDEYGDEIQIQNGVVYLGANPAKPEVGDQRISFQVVEPGTVSVIAQQDGNSFRPYKTSNGKTIEMLSKGDLSAEEMFDKAQSANKTMTWIFRLVGFLMMFIGLQMVFKVLSVIGSVIPFLGDLIGMGTGIVSFLIALATALIVISIAWIVARPLIGGALLVIAVGALAYLFVLKKKAPAAKK